MYTTEMFREAVQKFEVIAPWGEEGEPSFWFALVDGQLYGPNEGEPVPSEPIASAEEAVKLLAAWYPRAAEILEEGQGAAL